MWRSLLAARSSLVFPLLRAITLEICPSDLLFRRSLKLRLEALGGGEAEACFVMFRACFFCAFFLLFGDDRRENAPLTIIDSLRGERAGTLVFAVACWPPS